MLKRIYVEVGPSRSFSYSSEIQYSTNKAILVFNGNQNGDIEIVVPQFSAVCDQEKKERVFSIPNKDRTAIWSAVYSAGIKPVQNVIFELEEKALFETKEP